jgi:hypothetical protein
VVLALIPFVHFYVPPIGQILLAFAAGAVYVLGIFWFFKALSLFETSRVVPAISSLVPLFTFGLVYVFSLGKEILSLADVLALILLISGSFLIVAEKEKLVNVKSLKISAVAAFFLSLSFVLLKYVYLAQSFWSGFIWTKIGGFLMALLFLIFIREIKENISKNKLTYKKKTAIIFFANQAGGAGANILQNWAIALAPLVYVAVINALQGIQYVFLLLLSIFISLRFPQMLKERISGKIILQKIFAILLIGAGLALIAL